MADILVGIGSNIERDHYIRAGLDALHAEFGALTISTVYESEAVGFDGSPFLNLVVMFASERPLLEIVGVLKGIEIANGRSRQSKKFSPRTLDLDLLMYDDVITDEHVQLPRDEILTNAFVLKPLTELVPEKVHPIEKRTMMQILDAYSTNQKLWPIAFEWKPKTL